MIIRIQIGRWRFTFSFAPVTPVVGVNSNLPDGNHILMWDYDDISYEEILYQLAAIQSFFNLPNIYILETKRGKSYIAYCFKRVPWRRAVEIIGASTSVDWKWFKYGIYRGHFTLRVSPKCGRKPRLAYVMHSDTPEDTGPKELRSWVKYQTLPDGWVSKEWLRLTLKNGLKDKTSQ